MSLRCLHATATLCLSILVLLVASTAPGASLADKKIVQYGNGIPDAADLRLKHAAMETVAFDGVIMKIMAPGTVDYGQGSIGWKVFTKTRFQQWQYQQSITDLQATQFTRFFDNFVQVLAMPGDIDWFDPEWSSVAFNASCLAKVAKQGGCKGIMFDPEDYSQNHIWWYNSMPAAWRAAHTFAEYRVKIRERGREFIQAINAEYPDLIVFSLVGPSYTYTLGQHADAEYGLLLDFYDGMCEAATPGTIIIDGYEQSYGFRDRVAFFRGRDVILEKTKNLSGNPEAFAAHMRVGFGIWADNWSTYWGWSPTNFSVNYFTPDQFRASLQYAMEASDGYVWVYTEVPSWWDSTMPVEYKNALVQAKNGSAVDTVVPSADYVFISALGEDVVQRLNLGMGRAGWTVPIIPVADPWDATFGPDGNLYISSSSGNVVKKYDFETQTLSDYVSVGVPLDLTFFNGSLYVLSNLNDDDKIYRQKSDGSLELYCQPMNTRDFAFGPDRNGDGKSDLYTVGGEIRVYTHPGDAGVRFDSGSPAGSHVYTLTWGPDVSGADGVPDLFVGDIFRDAVAIYDGATGAYVRDFVTTASGGLGQPMDIGFGPDGNLYVVDQSGTPTWGAVRIYDGDTGYHVESIEGLNAPNGIAFRPGWELGTLAGHITLEDYSGDLVLAPVQIDFSCDGTFVHSATVCLDAGGAYSVESVPVGTYEVTFSACQWLPKVVTGISITGGNAVACDVTLLNGDVNGDNAVGSGDISIVLPKLDQVRE